MLRTKSKKKKKIPSAARHAGRSTSRVGYHKNTGTGLDGNITSRPNGRIVVSAETDAEWQTSKDGHAQFEFTTLYLLTNSVRAIIKSYRFCRITKIRITILDPQVGIYKGTGDTAELVQLTNVSSIGVYALVDTAGYLDEVPQAKISDSMIRQTPGNLRLSARPKSWNLKVPQMLGFKVIQLPGPDASGKYSSVVKFYEVINNSYDQCGTIPRYVYLALSDYVNTFSKVTTSFAFVNVRITTWWECWGLNNPLRDFTPRIKISALPEPEEEEDLSNDFRSLNIASTSRT